MRDHDQRPAAADKRHLGLSLGGRIEMARCLVEDHEPCR
jgi:hypothetical protein